MKSYDKIPYYNDGHFGSYVYAFDKLDGSNIRCEWSRKRGWYKFGTRNNMIDASHEQFGEAIPLFLDKYGDSLPKIFMKEYKKIESFVVFSEFVGENSFAGYHDPDDVKDIILFDVNGHRKGFLPPEEFIRNFGELHIPEIIYEGEYNYKLINNVQKNLWDLKEGVICKGTFKTKKSNTDQVWMTKIKTKEWLRKVKDKLGDKALLEEVNGDRSLLI